MWLREFAKTFPGNAVCDLTRKHLDLYFGKHSEVSPKTRNERRNVVRMFLKWGVRQDYLRADNRLLESDAMTREVYEPEEIGFYSPTELIAMLEKAHARLRPVLALIALGGVRLQEAVRLTWEDVFKVEGHVEISSAKSKTRSRRLVTVCPALAGWLEPYRNQSGPLWTECLDKFHTDFNELRDSLEIPARRNGLRHGFCTFHYALHADEGLTAKEAGNSPAMVHACYKGLATKKEAAAWFSIRPEQPGNVLPLVSAIAKA
jgi:integrase